ncbi:hypothetical protein T265_11917 [Opisthorchis viverrini]|uniref:Uncharacterized protein n=1 Tax=Opisthorchis viverrini TaxID=6198 RepID=A0A074Z7Q3_OPIVI|nr:hypothetical protein T265_11917 [Opisthorchis viverrini]KER19250.1 hypothetical protein T265_11917 [Opisthorchis viverrini]
MMDSLLARKPVGQLNTLPEMSNYLLALLARLLTTDPPRKTPETPPPISSGQSAPLSKLTPHLTSKDTYTGFFHASFTMLA